MYKSYTMELAGRTLQVDIGRVAAQANGAAFMHYGDTVVLSTATSSDKPRDGIDFFPLSVEFEEKLYSVGKIPGGFNKREGKASENAVLTARVIDRPMRPLFPKDYRNDVALNNMVMSVDPECRPELVAMLGSAIAASISDIPFDGPCAMTQVGLVDGAFVINPSQEQWKNGDLNLTVASTKEKVMMIEAGANEVPEHKVLEAIYKAHEINQTVIAFINKIVEEVGKPKHTYESCAIPEQMFEDMKNTLTDWTDEQQIRKYLEDLLDKKAFDRKGLIYGMGHAIYSISDPRADIFKRFVKQLAREKGHQAEYALYEKVEHMAPEIIGEKRRMYKGVNANVDFYSGLVYSMLDLPPALYTPIFAMARIVGWSAHRLEELTNVDKIIRPAYMPLAPYRSYVKLEDR